MGNTVKKHVSTEKKVQPHLCTLDCSTAHVLAYRCISITKRIIIVREKHHILCHVLTCPEHLKKFCHGNPAENIPSFLERRKQRTHKTGSTTQSAALPAPPKVHRTVGSP
jgi:hypothetical protein